MGIFKASVQYNDLKGSVAADRSDMGGASKWLTQNGHINEEEYVIGISMYTGENHGVHKDPIFVEFLVSGLKGYENLPEMIQNSGEPIQVRKIQVEMNLTDFFAFFKRFEVTLSISGMLDDKEYSTE